MIGAYKSLTTVEYGRKVQAMSWAPFHGRLWQRNYYEHIIRNDAEWDRVRGYIASNPMRWEMDRENPNATPTSRSTPASTGWTCPDGWRV